MFGKMLGRKKEETSEDSAHEIVVQKVSKMNLSDMRNYVNNKVKDFEISEDGLCEVMQRLTSKDDNSKRFIESDAMDSKIKKAFELVLIIAKSKKVTVVATELIQEFIELYSDIILKYDTDHKQIYGSKLKEALSNTAAMLIQMAESQRKLGVIGS